LRVSARLRVWLICDACFDRLAGCEHSINQRLDRRAISGADAAGAPLEGATAGAAITDEFTLVPVDEVTGRVSKATRLMSIKCSGEMLSEVTLPPHEPQPSVIEGASAVEKPIAPCVEAN